MNDEISINISDLVGGPICVSCEDGQRVYEAIAPLLRQGRRVTLSFERVNIMIAAFLSAAVGQFYKEFEEDTIRNLISVTNMKQLDMALLDRVVENTKIYLKNPEAIELA